MLGAGLRGLSESKPALLRAPPACSARRPPAPCTVRLPRAPSARSARLPRAPRTVRPRGRWAGAGAPHAGPTRDWALSRATRACCSACWIISFLLNISSCSHFRLCRWFWFWLTWACSWLTLASNSAMVCSCFASLLCSSNTCCRGAREDRGVGPPGPNGSPVIPPFFPQKTDGRLSRSQVWGRQWQAASVCAPGIPSLGWCLREGGPDSLRRGFQLILPALLGLTARTAIWLLNHPWRSPGEEEGCPSR